MAEEADATGYDPALEAKSGSDLIFAARGGDVATVQQLLAAGVSTGFKDPSGWTALRWAASEGKEEVLALLLDHGASEDEAEASNTAAPAEEGTGGGSSLHWAAYKGHARLVWRLLTCKPKLNPKALDSEGNTPLHLAAATGHLVILQTLLSQGVDVSLKNAYGNTASAMSTSPECQLLLKEAAKAALDGRPYLCSCSGEFCSEAQSAGEEVIDKVSAPNVRPVRYSSTCLGEIRAAEDGLANAMKAADVETLDAAIKRAESIGASLPLIQDGIAGLERLRAQIALNEAMATLQGARPVSDKGLLRPLAAPLKVAREKGVADSIIGEAETLQTAVEAEVALYDVIAAVEPYKMVSELEMEEPPSAESDFARRAESGLQKLQGAMMKAKDVDASESVVVLSEQVYAYLEAESELRKALLPPKEGVTEDGAPCQTQHNGTKTYSQLEDLQFRTDFLDAALEKCTTVGTVEGIVAFGAKVQKELKALFKQAQIEDEERKAKEAAAAAKAAKKGKKKK